MIPTTSRGKTITVVGYRGLSGHTTAIHLANKAVNTLIVNLNNQPTHSNFNSLLNAKMDMEQQKVNRGIPLYPYPGNFTQKGKSLLIKLKNGKIANAKVLRCSGSYADVKLNGKIYLVDSNGTVKSC